MTPREFLSKVLKWIRFSASIRTGAGPVKDFAGLADFTASRAAYITQTSLFGYLKTRMGTRFPDLFQDKVFSAAIRRAQHQVLAACAGDLAIYAAVVTAQRADTLSDAEARTFAEALFASALTKALAEAEALPDGEGPHIDPAAERAAFAERAAVFDWRGEDALDLAFVSSQRRLAESAPVVDEFMALDREIVENSIRFRWNDVRRQLRVRLDAEAVLNSAREDGVL
ncbi:MAG: hypothetical protein ACYYKD_13000 [Rhodospirillales bacterium]